ncbi:MAG: DeoR family transcriptional regulator [Phycisphaerales bacterium]|nr:DeoR family transcriptional regulator [Phycisphaerales bacterium]
MLTVYSGRGSVGYAACSTTTASSLAWALNDRQHWVLEQLRAGGKLQRQDIEKHFRVAEKTAKRDLSDLVSRGLIVFERTPPPGYYRLVTKEGSGRSTHKVPQHRELQRGTGERVHEAV